jgi:hypothetical protein
MKEKSMERYMDEQHLRDLVFQKYQFILKRIDYSITDEDIEALIDLVVDNWYEVHGEVIATLVGFVPVEEISDEERAAVNVLAKGVGAMAITLATERTLMAYFRGETLFDD